MSPGQGPNPLFYCLWRQNHFLFQKLIFLFIPTRFFSFSVQEVDRTDKLFPVLQNAGYTPHYATGPRKRHGCLIAYRKAVFSQIGERKVLYDVEEIREEGNERARRGSSMVTRNIASMLALKRLDTDTEDEGIIVATTHLFWHPA